MAQQIEIKPFTNESALLVLAYGPTHLDDNLKLMSVAELNNYLQSHQVFLSAGLESLATFQQRLLASDFPNLFGVWHAQQLLGYILQTDRENYQTSDFPDEIAHQVVDFIARKQ
ncbi:hypothetical protein [Lapidilactobacillus bayanensis]|uniref:hypothetical protein n=1 Tax=Lapidilactobacillus bayanensis TaxID=2485998 RepID=UPI000F7B4BAE|nr:hypothetical protein [Lapidilactobacillus bayanensis]